MIMKKACLLLAVCALAVSAFARKPWKSDVADGDLVWIDGSSIPLEGRGFGDPGEDVYRRLPAAVREKPDLFVIKGMAKSSTGLNFTLRRRLRRSS